MSTQPPAPENSLFSRLLFFLAGTATAIAMSVSGIGGFWTIPVAIIALVVFGEIYLYFTGTVSHGQ